MKMHSFPYLFTALLAFSISASAADAIDAKVSIAEARFSPQASDKQALVPAGDLEYVIELATRCEPGSEPASLSLGVADTRHHFSLADTGNPGRVSATFLIPGQQLAPVITRGYCIADDPQSQTTMLVAAAFTAQVSLVCRSGDSSSLHHLSQPLSLKLICVSGEDQDAASASAR